MEYEVVTLQSLHGGMQDCAAPGGEAETQHIRADGVMSKLIYWMTGQHILSEGDRITCRAIADMYEDRRGDWWYA